MNYWHTQESDVEWLRSLKRQAKDLELVVTGLVLLTVFLLIVFAGSIAK